MALAKTIAFWPCPDCNHIFVIKQKKISVHDILKCAEKKAKPYNAPNFVLCSLVAIIPISKSKKKQQKKPYVHVAMEVTNVRIKINDFIS